MNIPINLMVPEEDEYAMYSLKMPLMPEEEKIFSFNKKIYRVKRVIPCVMAQEGIFSVTYEVFLE